MGSWLLRAEGVNFSATIDDTNELSTMRGGSLTLLRLGEAVGKAVDEHIGTAPQLVFSGASQCAFTFDGDHDPEEIESAVRKALAESKAEPPFDQLTIVIDVVPLQEGTDGRDKALKQALKHAEARNKARQFRQWTLSPLPFPTKARDADPFDFIRPGTEPTRLPKGKVLSGSEDDADTGENHEVKMLSPAVERRRQYGRRARQLFYRDELGKADADTILGDLGFTDSIQHIVDDAPGSVPESLAGKEHIVDDAPGVLPSSLAGKVAVVYADGNGFGGIRDKVGPQKFSDEVQELRGRLLATVLRWYASGTRRKECPKFAVRHGVGGNKERLGLRFETLLWGGDEFCFVMPSWLAFAFVNGFFAVTRKWEIGGEPLTHAVGVAIAHHKTPIRQLRHIAKQAADEAKDAGLRSQNSVTFEIYESLAPPDIDFDKARAKTYGTDKTALLAGWLALPGDTFATCLDHMALLTAGVSGGDVVCEPFPRSQIYGAIRAARIKSRSLVGSDTDTNAADAVSEYLDTYRLRAGGEAQVDRLDGCLLPRCVGQRPLSLDLLMIAAFWDYAHPFGPGNLPAFPTGAEDHP